LTEKEKKEKGHIEELHKVDSETVKKERHACFDHVVSAHIVGEVRKGLVTGSSVGQARKEIEQGKGSNQQSTESSQQEEKK